jgi:tetratricopeptide (TPR) repeat protein
MKKIIKLLLVLLIPSFTQACLWLEGTTIDGEHKTFEDKTISSLFLGMSQHTTPKENFKSRFYRENNQTLEYKALKNIMESNYEEGIKQLLSIEKKKPNLYETASNLGTAYELQGNIPLAIEWIKEGIKRNAESHGGTEWLHLLILETKLQLESFWL